MRRSKLRTPSGLILAAILFLAAAFVGWLAVQTTAVEMLSGRSARVTPIVAGAPDVVLGTAMTSLLARRGVVKPQLLPSIRGAAARVPLDARPYVLIASDYLRSGRTAQGVKTLEAGRRLDPRQRWIHVLLLDHYLRSEQFAQAADEFAVLARLVGGAQSPIATALAQMAVAPETRDAVRKTFRQDAALERSVLIALAGNNNVEPAMIFSMASPAAFAAANTPGGWGIVLVDRLVEKRRYRMARAVWQRINRLSDQQVAPLLYDAGLAALPGKPPFNWMLASNNVAAVDVRGNRFNIEYYGRDSGDLASQLLVLSPGTYRFSYVVNNTQQDSGPDLVWSFSCANKPDPALASMELPQAKSRPRRVAFNVTVPADCPAQWLRLAGLAGEFPVSVSTTIDRLKLEKAPSQ